MYYIICGDYLPGIYIYICQDVYNGTFNMCNLLYVDHT